jgi:hypothetical protein
MGLLTSMLGIDGIAGAAEGIVKSISGAIGKFIPDANTRLQVEAEVRKSVAEGLKSQYDAMSSVMTADANSDSQLTRNARPIVVYWSLGMITTIVGASLVGYADPMLVALAKVPDKLYEMIALGVGIFTAGRSAEKVASTISNAITKR